MNHTLRCLQNIYFAYWVGITSYVKCMKFEIELHKTHKFEVETELNKTHKK